MNITKILGKRAVTFLFLFGKHYKEKRQGNNSGYLPGFEKGEEGVEKTILATLTPPPFPSIPGPILF
jgi:hypothetical protein